MMNENSIVYGMIINIKIDKCLIILLNYMRISKKTHFMCIKAIRVESFI